MYRVLIACAFVFLACVDLRSGGHGQRHVGGDFRMLSHAPDRGQGRSSSLPGPNQVPDMFPGWGLSTSWPIACASATPPVAVFAMGFPGRDAEGLGRCWRVPSWRFSSVLIPNLDVVEFLFNNLALRENNRSVSCIFLRWIFACAPFGRPRADAGVASSVDEPACLPAAFPPRGR